MYIPNALFTYCFRLRSSRSCRVTIHSFEIEFFKAALQYEWLQVTLLTRMTNPNHSLLERTFLALSYIPKRYNLS